MNRLFNNTTPQNVHGWERTASVAGGLVLLGKGLRRGGVSGLLQLAMGGMALARGISGRCEAKRILTETEPSHSRSHAQQDLQDKQRYSHMPLDSEVHSPDFAEPEVTLPDSTPMGHEQHPSETNTKV